MDTTVEAVVRFERIPGAQPRVMHWTESPNAKAAVKASPSYAKALAKRGREPTRSS